MHPWHTSPLYLAKWDWPPDKDGIKYRHRELGPARYSLVPVSSLAPASRCWISTGWTSFALQVHWQSEAGFKERRCFWPACSNLETLLPDLSLTQTLVVGQLRLPFEPLSWQHPYLNRPLQFTAPPGSFRVFSEAFPASYFNPPSATCLPAEAGDWRRASHVVRLEIKLCKLPTPEKTSRANFPSQLLSVNLKDWL